MSIKRGAHTQSPSLLPAAVSCSARGSWNLGTERAAHDSSSRAHVAPSERRGRAEAMTLSPRLVIMILRRSQNTR